MSLITKIRISKYDKEWSLLVRKRDGKCLYCGKTEFLDAHHFLRRSIKSTRLMLENGISLCKSHHTFNHEFSAHLSPEKFKRWFKRCYPDRVKLAEKKAKQHMTERQAILEFKELIKNI